MFPKGNAHEHSLSSSRTTALFHPLGTLGRLRYGCRSFTVNNDIILGRLLSCQRVTCDIRARAIKTRAFARHSKLQWLPLGRAKRNFWGNTLSERQAGGPAPATGDGSSKGQYCLPSTSRG